MKQLGRHLLVEYMDCDSKLLDNLKVIEEIMLAAARCAKAHILTYSFHKFAPQGVSGAVIIAESHLTIHTWPEFGYAAVDVFTCGTSADPDAAVQFLMGALNARHGNTTERSRGIIYPALHPASSE